MPPRHQRPRLDGPVQLWYAKREENVVGVHVGRGCVVRATAGAEGRQGATDARPPANGPASPSLGRQRLSRRPLYATFFAATIAIVIGTSLVRAAAATARKQGALEVLLQRRSLAGACKNSTECHGGSQKPQGSCVDGKCSCNGPWGASTCNECLCQNGGTCEYSLFFDTWSCACTSNFTGSYCEDCATGYVPTHGECKVDTCPGMEHCTMPYGRCFTIAGDHTWCDCYPPWAGNNCTECLCKNGGTCVNPGGPSTEGQFSKCSCRMGFVEGEYCQCPSTTETTVCSGHGVCGDLGCNCSEGWSTDDCSVGADPPTGSPDEDILIISIAGAAVVILGGFVVFLTVRRRSDSSPLLEKARMAAARQGTNDANTYHSLDEAAALSSWNGRASLGSSGSAAGGLPNDNVPSPDLRRAMSAVEEEYLIQTSDIVVGDMIAVGTSSQVFRGLYKNQPIAVKKMPLSTLLRSDIRKAEFEREASILSKTRHPNVVLFHGLAHSEHHMLIVTEFCPYSLAQLMRVDPWPPEVPSWARLAKRVAKQIAEGMTFLHSQDIVHRDLKPENILVDNAWIAKICDFGVARLMQGSGEQFTMTGQIGTPIYMAPEIISGSRNRYGKSADVYSFGILLWAIWNKTVPYKSLIQREGLDAFQLAHRVTQGLRPDKCTSPHETPTVATDMPDSIQQLMRQCWNSDPSRRPNFAEVLEILAQ